MNDSRVTSGLADFVRRFPFVERNWGDSEIYLYHGTNCYRRMEIRMGGEIGLGRAGLIFLCSNADRAYDYGRVACLRDEVFGFRNTLSHEPVLLKVVFSPEDFCDVDYVRNVNPNVSSIGGDLVLAVNKPINAERIVEVLHCEHGLEFLHDKRSSRSLEDERLVEGIKHLRGQASQLNPEIWAARRVAGIEQRFTTKEKALEITPEDELRRLRRLTY